MQIDFSQILLDLNGHPHADERHQPLTLRQAVITICSAPAQGDDALSTIDKYNIGKIGSTVARSTGPLDIPVEDIAILKDRSGKVFVSPALVYTIHQMLEGN